MLGFNRTIRLYRAARARQRSQQRIRLVATGSWSRLAWRAICDSSGGEVLEFALVAGLIVIASISIITCVGVKITNKWSSINSKM